MIPGTEVQREKPEFVISDSGTAPGTGVLPRGIRANVFIGRIGPATTRAVRVRLRTRAIGRIRTALRATLNDAGNLAAVRFIRVIR